MWAGVIIVVEGPSAAGKSTWVAAHCRPATVIGETPRGSAPDRAIDPDGAAAHWAALSAARWHAASQAERQTGLHAVEQLDPARVRWELPATGIPGITSGPRRDRTGTDAFDALIGHLPAR